MGVTTTRWIAGLALGLLACGGDSGGGGSPDAGGSAADAQKPPSCPTEPGEPVPVDGPFVSDGAFLYFAGDGAIARLPVDGDQPEDIVVVPELLGRLQLAGDELFFLAGPASAPQIHRAPKAGGQPVLVRSFPADAAGQYVSHSVDADFSYAMAGPIEEWILSATPRAGGGAVELARGSRALAGAADLPHPDALVGHDGRLFWVTGAGLVRSVAATGGTVAELADSQVSPAARTDAPDIAVDDTHVHWSVSQQAQPAYPLFRVARDGGERETLLEGVQALGLRQWAGSLYFVDVGDPAEYRIGRIDKAGGAYDIIGCYDPASWDLVVDESGVYADAVSGTLRFPL